MATGTPCYADTQDIITYKQLQLLNSVEIWLRKQGIKMIEILQVNIRSLP